MRLSPLWIEYHPAHTLNEAAFRAMLYLKTKSYWGYRAALQVVTKQAQIGLDGLE
jgi:hypothetical protein